MSAHRHFAFVIHGSRAELPATRELIDRVRGEGHRVDPCITYTPGDAERFAREGAEEGATVVALGGDGTLNEVVNGLDGHDVPLGIVPMGTANDFARQVGIPLEPDHAMDVILARKPVRIDTAELNGRRFLNVSTGGVGAEATAETPADAKEALGPVAYAITGVRKLAALEPRHAAFAGPNFRLECGFFTFAVGNGRTTGGGTVITPLARLDDGLLDLVVFETMSRRDVPAAIMRVRRGEHLEAEGVHYAQLPEVCITSAEPLSVNVDGEPLSAARLEYRARPLDLRVHLPPRALAHDGPKQSARRR